MKNKLKYILFIVVSTVLIICIFNENMTTITTISDKLYKVMKPLFLRSYSRALMNNWEMLIFIIV